jgi:hypothetical protein
MARRKCVAELAEHVSLRIFFREAPFSVHGKGNEDNQAGAGIDTEAGWRSDVELKKKRSLCCSSRLFNASESRRFIRRNHRHIESGLKSSLAGCIKAA